LISVAQSTYPAIDLAVGQQQLNSMALGLGPQTVTVRLGALIDYNRCTG
jgi:hypothetical protein